jgi:hypothetical protein
MVMQQDSSDETGVAVRGGANKGAARRARSRKANAALALKVEGATYEQIAETLGFPTARAALVAVERALEDHLAHDLDRDKLRTLAGQRLDALLRSVWPKATNEDAPEHLAAAGRAREIVQDFRRLHGLDAPTEVTVTTPTTGEIEAWVAEVMSVRVPPVQEMDILALDSSEFSEVADDAVPAG